ncbi:MAG: BREX system serine/threonine kinase PglW [Candidatus Xenobia bacterium]
MGQSSERWTIVTPSEFAWEREALDFLRANLPETVLHVWSNFEFMTDGGSIYEVDALALTVNGIFVIEIKSWSGTLTGDQNSWVRTQGNRTWGVDNPAFLTNRKAKKLLGLLENQAAFAKGGGLRVPFIQPVVFLSSPNLKIGLSNLEGQPVFNRTRLLEAFSPKGRFGQVRITKPIEMAVYQALKGLNIKPARRRNSFGDYRLEKLLAEGPGYQDRLGKHVKLEGVERRIRVYAAPPTASDEARERVRRMARREFTLVDSVKHPGILRAEDLRTTEMGAALIFEHDPNAVRLDHFVRTRADKMQDAQRFSLVRQIAEALQYAHRRTVWHRALSPQSILVYGTDSAQPTVRIMNWQTGMREGGTTSGTIHIEDLVEDGSVVYLAPEAVKNPQNAGTYTDVFSLGAVAFFIFTGQPPASNPAELEQVIRDHQGLEPSAVVDGISDKIDELISAATHPDVGIRLNSVDEFLELMTDVEAEITAPTFDPENPHKGQVLPQNLTVWNKIGAGAVSFAILVARENVEYVLKVAREPRHNSHLKDEGATLRKLDNKHIVKLHEEFDIDARHALLLQRAGDRTLARFLAEGGPLHIDLLQRFGDDLLSAVAYLEKTGINHRDIKPANIGVSSDDHLHLLLFDFSLSQTPTSNIEAGTPGYRDPFLSLRKPPQWDPHAERYAVAVTLYEMATGQLPRWGDDRSDPSLVDCQLVLQAERFHPSLRDTLTAFFLRGLNRDWRARFDHADEMRAAWRQVFEKAVEEEKSVSRHDDPVGDSPPSIPESATLDSPVTALHLTPAALQALDRLNVLTVRDMLSRRDAEIRFIGGIGNKTRRQLAEALTVLRKRFPQIDVNDEAPEADPRSSSQDPGSYDVDLLAQSLGPRRKGQSDVLRHLFLGIDEALPAATWMTHADLASRLGLKSDQCNEAVTKCRSEWKKSKPLASLRDQLPAMLASYGGVATLREMAGAIYAARGSISNDFERRIRLAAAVCRAAVEVESEEAEPRFGFRRHHEQVLLATSPDLFDYAARLGVLADRLADEEPLAPPYRVIEQLRAVAPPESMAFISNHRLLQIASSFSVQAAVSSRQELYPRGLKAGRALQLGYAALLGRDQLSVKEIQDQIAARYPDAEALPDESDALLRLLHNVGSDLKWDSAIERFLRPASLWTLSTGSTMLPRHRTTGGRVSSTPEAAEAREFEERLVRSYATGGFLVLMVEPRYLERAARELSSRFAVADLSLDEMLLAAMRRQADELEVSWEVVLQADRTPGTADWENLLRLVADVGPAVRESLVSQTDHLLLQHIGLLLRYKQDDLIEALRTAVGQRNAPASAWLLLPTDRQHDMPVLDGHVIPLLSKSQRARIPEGWLANAHRGSAKVDASAMTGSLG